MGIQNGPAPEGGAIDWMTTLTMERDSLQVQLQESERRRKEAFQACETTRRERDEWKAAVEYQQEQATQLRQQAEALEASLEHEQSANRVLAGEVVKLQTQLDAAAVTPTQQPDGTAERLEAVRRMIGEIRGWYACVECLGEQSAETWEQVGALLGHLQGKAD